MKKIFLLMGLTLMSFAAYAQAPAGMPYTFVPNTPAKAAEVNANFDALLQAAQTLSTLNQQQQAQIDDLLTRLNAAETALGAAQTQIAALESAQSSTTADITVLQTHVVEGLSNFVEVTTDAKGYDLIRFTGVNVQLRHAASSTTSVNGLGNFIIGQNDTGSTEFCSDSNINTEHNTTISEQANCELLPHNHSGSPTIAGIWNSNQRSGSHNLIIGDEHDYTASGALIMGDKNISNAGNASILGGSANLASAPKSVIAAGKHNNTKIGASGFIGGGSYNQTSGSYAATLGGNSNTASGTDSSVAGGYENTASSHYSSVAGGSNNTANGNSSSVSGGYGNAANGNYSSVLGGNGNTVNGSTSSVAGGGGNTASGTYSSVLGGNSNTASGTYSSIGGGSSVTNGTSSKFSAEGTISP